MPELPPGRLSADELGLGRRIRSGLGVLFTSPTPTAVGLLDSRILLVNDAFVRVTGYERDELVGVPSSNLLPVRDRAVTQARRDALLAEATSADAVIADAYHHTLALIAKDGSEINVRGTSVLLRSRDGAPVAFVTRLVPVSPSDVPPPLWTGRLERADAALLADALVENPGLDDLAVPTTLVSPAGILLRVNPAFTGAFGWENGEVAGLLAADLLVPELRSWADERLAEITGASLLPPPATARVRHRDGRAIPVESSSIPVRDDRGHMRYLVGTARPSST